MSYTAGQMAASDLDTELIGLLRGALAEGRGDAIELRRSLSGLLLDGGRAVEAFDLCRELLAEAPDDAETLELAAEASLALGQGARASRYRKVLEALRAGASPPGELVHLRLVRPGGDGDH